MSTSRRTELSFFPACFNWPVDESAPMPSEEALSRIDAYMQQGGSVLFRYHATSYGGGSVRRCRQPRHHAACARSLAGIDVAAASSRSRTNPRGLTKTFFMPQRNSRVAFSGGPAVRSRRWAKVKVDPETLPVRQGDGVDAHPDHRQ